MSRSHRVPVVLLSAIALGAAGATNLAAQNPCPSDDYRAIRVTNLPAEYQTDIAWLKHVDSDGDGIVCLREWGEFLGFEPTMGRVRAEELNPHYFVFVDNRADRVFLDPRMVVDILITTRSGVKVIDPRSKDRVLVTILGTSMFDPTVLDVTTLKFGPDGATPMCSTGGHLDDENGDGHVDLFSCYDPRKTGLTAADTLACLTGETVGGAQIRGCATVQVARKK